MKGHGVIIANSKCYFNITLNQFKYICRLFSLVQTHLNSVSMACPSLDVHQSGQMQHLLCLSQPRILMHIVAMELLQGLNFRYLFSPYLLILVVSFPVYNLFFGFLHSDSSFFPQPTSIEIGNFRIENTSFPSMWHDKLNS